MRALFMAKWEALTIYFYTMNTNNLLNNSTIDSNILQTNLMFEDMNSLAS